MFRFGLGLVVGFLLCCWALNTMPQVALQHGWDMLNHSLLN